MFAYTLNLNTWQMAQDKPEEPKEKRTYKRNHPDISLRNAFASKYPEWSFIVDELKAAIGSEPTWRLMTRSNLIKFIDHLNTKFAPNTVNQYATRLKVVLNMYAEEFKLPVSYAKILSPRKIPSTAVFLNKDELKRLEEYQPKNDYEKLVRNLFVASSYTGARYIDIMRMNKSNIRGNELVFVAQKTHKEARLPLKPIVAKYIEEMPSLSITKAGYINIIQRICKNIGLTEPVKILKAGKEVEIPKYEAISSHTARRSHATNLYLRGVDVYTISKMLQHSNVAYTAKYICVNLRPLTDKEMEYFK